MHGLHIRQVMVNVLQHYPRPGDLWRQAPRAVAFPRIPAPATTMERRGLLAALWSQYQDRRQDVTRMLEFAAGDQISLTPGMPAETAAHQLSKPRFAANLLGYILDRFSYLYAEPPLRKSASDDRWREVLWDYGIGLNAILDDSMSPTRLIGTSLAYVTAGFGVDTPQDPSRVAGTAGARPTGLDVWVLPQDRWMALTHPTDPRYVWAVLIDVGETMDGDTPVAVYHYWDDTRFAVMHGGAVVSESPHGMGAPPCCTIKGTLAPAQIYGQPIGGADMIDNLRSINSITEELLHVARLQRGQPVVVGHPENLQLGPDCPVHTEAAGDFTIVPNQANIGGIIDSLSLALDRLAQSLGMPRSSFRVTDSPSGAAVMADRLELAEDRRKQSLVWQRNEQMLHAVASRVWLDWTGERLDPSITVTYPERPAMLTHAERMSEVQLQLAEGLISRREAVARLDPGRTVDELDAMLAEADEDIPARMRWRAVIAGHAEDIAPRQDMEEPQDTSDASQDDASEDDDESR